MPRKDVPEILIYAALKAHCAARGIDVTAWPNQQAIVPDEFRAMRAALRAVSEAGWVRAEERSTASVMSARASTVSS